MDYGTVRTFEVGKVERFVKPYFILDANGDAADVEIDRCLALGYIPSQPVLPLVGSFWFLSGGYCQVTTLNLTRKSEQKETIALSATNLSQYWYE